MTRTLGAIVTSAFITLMLIAAPVRAAEDPVGQWDLTVEWPQGAAKVLLTVERVQGGLRVTWQGPQGTLEGKSPTFVDGVLSFAIAVSTQAGTSVDLRYEGRIASSTITGKLVTPANREIPASGTRRKS